MTLLDGRIALPDSSLLMTRLDALVRGHRHHGPHAAVVALEVDHFENICETFGDSVAEQVLSGVIELVQRRTGSADLFLDTGAETLCLLLLDTEPEAAGYLVHQLRTAVAGENLVDGYKVTLSAGVATVHHDDSALSCLARAHTFLDDARRHGRNRVSCESPLP